MKILPKNGDADTDEWKSFRLRGTISKWMDGLTLEEEIVVYEVWDRCIIFDGKVNVEQYISEMIHISKSWAFG